MEDTIQEDDNLIGCDKHHRHYDYFSEKTLPGTRFSSCAHGLEPLIRRKQARLGVSRPPYQEPLGKRRDDFYEQKLLLGLPWYCSEAPKMLPNRKLQWTFRWTSPISSVASTELQIIQGEPPAFEHECKALEDHICASDDIVCRCCAMEETKRCRTCIHAKSFHICSLPSNDKKVVRWAKGTLHAGHIDYERIIFNLHRKHLPIPSLKTKGDQFVEEGRMKYEDAQAIIKTIEGERGKERMTNAGDDNSEHDASNTRGKLSERLTSTELQASLNVNMVGRCRLKIGEYCRYHVSYINIFICIYMSADIYDSKNNTYEYWYG